MKLVYFHPQASAELSEAVTYYEEQRNGLGLALLAEVEQATSNIRAHPEIGAPYKNTELRRLVLQRFPFVLYYLQHDEALWIIAMAHGRRRPDYWRRRRPGG